MAIKMVREPSDSPNITNLDDFVGLRYAYHDQEGYVPNRGSELAYEISGSTFRVLSGRVVTQGIECDIDATGVDLPVDIVATKRYHLVYLRVSLARMDAQVLSLYDTAGVPELPISDDLTNNTIGSSYVALYSFESLNGVISSVTKLVQGIKHTSTIAQEATIPVDTKVFDLENRLRFGLLVVGKAETAFSDYQRVEQAYTYVSEKYPTTGNSYGAYTPLNIHMSPDRLYVVIVEFISSVYPNSSTPESQSRLYDSHLRQLRRHQMFLVDTYGQGFSTPVMMGELSSDTTFYWCGIEYVSYSDIRYRLNIGQLGNSGEAMLPAEYSGNIRVTCFSL